jgi:hypothetical protein
MHFSLHRFGLLVRRRWAEQGRLYLMGLAVLTGLMGLAGLHTVIFEKVWSQPMQSRLFWVGLLLAGPFFASGQFSDLTDKARGSLALMLPASPLEKVAVAVFFAFVVFVPAFVAAFYLIDMPLVELARGQVSRSARAQEPAGLLNVLTYWTHEGDVSPFPLFIVLQTIALLGSVFAGRYAYVKTALVLLVVVFGGVLFNNVLLAALLGVPDVRGVPFETVTLQTAPYAYDTLYVPPALGTLMRWLGGVVLPLALLGITYRRFTEKEI